MLGNAIMTIHPYPTNKNKGFSFDEPRLNVYAEPFVAGIPEMMYRACEKFGIDPNNLTCNFSATKFPSKSLVHLTWLESTDEKGTGNVYRWEEENMEGWFCPCLLKFFGSAPKNLYIEFLN